jgi:hypothetical protein
LPERIEATKSLTEVAVKIVPWYQRLLSTLGFVAFVSLLFGTLLQSLNSITTNVELRALETKYEDIKAREEHFVGLTGVLSQLVLENYAKDGIMPFGGEDVLNLRVEQLEEKELDPDQEIVRELFHIYIATNRIEDAVSLVDLHQDILAKSELRDRMTLALFHYFNGSLEKAVELVRDIRPSTDALSAGWKLRFLALDALLSNDGEVTQASIQTVASAYATSPQAAEARIRRQIQSFRESATWLSQPSH